MSRQNKTSLDETIAVKRPLHEVFAYIADFSRVGEWDPAVSHATRLTGGAPGVGTEYEVVMRSGLKLKYTVVGFEENSQIEMSVESRLFTAKEKISFEFSGNFSHVRYRADFDFVAPLAAVIRVYPGGLDRVGKNAMSGLKKALEDPKRRHGMKGHKKHAKREAASVIDERMCHAIHNGNADHLSNVDLPLTNTKHTHKGFKS